ncbi:MAG: DNA-binding response regulator, partial [Candidatus Latescibacteria bacterium]|nr:DNA-binding response regulator [Candidatus Latescibacterota bacterium]
MPDKILVVEDDPTLLQSIVQLLTLDGYDITTAIDGEEGIKEFK